MTVAIITQPLMENYGGLLQNFALQKAITRILPEADVITFDQVDSLAPWYYRAGSRLKQLLRRTGSRKSIKEPTVFEQFINRNIFRTKKAKAFRNFKNLTANINRMSIL